MKLAEARIGLALSGGGFRATLFHLGVIKLLRDVGALGAIKHISAVSGGSIAAAHLVLNWEAYNSSAEGFESAAKKLLEFVQTDIRGHIVRRWLLGCLSGLPRFAFAKESRWHFGHLLQSSYAKLFDGATLIELQKNGRPKVTFNCTSLTTGSHCKFDETGFWWKNEQGERRHILAADIPVALAVAASSAFPPLFRPIEISHETLSADNSDFPNTHYLTDGGVYDNLGIESLVAENTATNKLDVAIISDAEGNFDANFKTRYSLPVGRNVRASDLLMKRVSELQLDTSADQSWLVKIKIKGEINNSKLTPEAQRLLVNVRTDLDRFSPIEVTALIAHGYSKASCQLVESGWHSRENSEFSWDPMANLTSLTTEDTIQKLQESSCRKLRLWSWRDLASWVTIALIAFYIGLLLVPITFLAAKVQQHRDQARLDRLNEAIIRDSTGWQSWQYVRIDGCSGHDVANTDGSKPLDKLCGQHRTAVCWDGISQKSPSKSPYGEAWCTYKNLAPDQCIGSTSPGRLYQCAPEIPSQ